MSFIRNSGFWDDFGKQTSLSNQRESYYVINPYIAEFWCCISSIGFIYTGIKYKKKTVLFAGIFSMISHAIPLYWLNRIDIAASIILGFDCGLFIIDFIILLRDEGLFKRGIRFRDLPYFKRVIGICFVGIFDIYIGFYGKHLPTYFRTYFHVFWHLYSSYIIYKLCKNKIIR